jgi:predicted lipoprotein with Yx(FWY)xxD motif
MSMNIKYLASGVLTVIVAGIAAIVLAVGGGSAKTRLQRSGAAGSAVGIRSSSLGKTLVDAKGRTLYLFEGDRTNVSTLSNAGLAVWPRFIAHGPVKALNGAQAVKVSTISNGGGGRQVTYQSHPLYYFVGDTTPGSTNGQGLNEFGALWYVLGPGGSAVTHSPSKATATSTPASGY